jgi:DNA-binding NarL/FixJ family response regulator
MNRRYADKVYDSNTKFQQEFNRRPTRTEARRYQVGTLMKYTKDELIQYKEQIPKIHYPILMFWVDGKNQKEIAAELQLPIGTVKSRTHRGCKIIDKIRAANAITV